MMAQCRKPSGLFGFFMTGSMNHGHAELTQWGLRAVSIEEDFTILDVGCGGGATVRRLAEKAPRGKVYGIDYSGQSVAASCRTNRRLIQAGQVDIRQGTVSDLPYPDHTFDLVSAVETHYFWPDLEADLREVRRVLKPGGRLLIIGALYKGSPMDERNAKWLEAGDMANLSPDEFKALLSGAAYKDIEVSLNPEQGWIRCTAKKP
jgi:ubiquinone/menaquinone biosynthesis C-methylase UbiE